jgi:paraquat-inducible protein B
MRRKTNPTLIGAFVVGAVILAVIGVTIFGSGRFFHKTREFVIYFRRSVNGLRVGAPVKFKGVEIGAVDRIYLRLGSAPPTPGEVRIPVIVVIDDDRIAEQTEGVPLERTVEEMIQLGLRAQLATESIVTGVLYVELDFHPDAPPPQPPEPDAKYVEIPTVPTAFERVQMQASEFLMKLSAVDFDALVHSVRQAIDAVNTLVGSPKLRAAVDGLDGTIRNLDDAIADIRRLAGGFETAFVPLGGRLRATADKADASLEGVRVLLQPGSPLTYQLGRTLEEVGAAARAVRGLADTLERDPAVLVRGKYVPPEDGR